jgi:hypothetical protein
MQGVPNCAKQLFPVVAPGINVAYLAQLALRCAFVRIPVDFPDMNCVPRNYTLLNADKIFLQLLVAHKSVV